jgi:hypothetical protein
MPQGVGIFACLLLEPAVASHLIAKFAQYFLDTLAGYRFAWR